MRTSTNILDNRIFNLASNLFDSNRFEIPVVEAKKSIKEKIKCQLAILPDDHGKQMAVYPAIVGEAMSQTMDKYRKFVALKNIDCKTANQEINSFNANVLEYREAGLNEVQIQFSELFIKNNKLLAPTQYNQKVLEFCKDYGPIVEKKKLVTIKPATELFFQNILFLYNQQLMKKNTRHMSIKLTSKMPLEPFKLNSWKVTQLKRDGVKSLDFCPKTIRNHRDRLIEFGIFTDYHFAGTFRGVQLLINSEILVTKDLFFGNSAITDNQLLKVERCKVLPDNNDNLTRTFIKESEKKQNASDFSEDKVSLPLDPFIFSFTRTPKTNQLEKTGGAAAVPTNSSKLENLIINEQELFEQLTSRNFSEYRPIDIRVLYQEATSGTLSDYEFHSLFIREFLKEAQKNIYKTAPVYKGSWAKAFYIINESYGIKYNGDKYNGIPYDKNSILGLWKKCRFGLKWARDWYAKNPKIKPLFPNQYFDRTRKDKREIGFEYAKSKYDQHLKTVANSDLRRRKREAAAELRKQTINHSKKCKTAVNRFFANKITLTELHDYVEKNLPKQFIEKLPQMITKKEEEIAIKSNFDLTIYNNSN